MEVFGCPNYWNNDETVIRTVLRTSNLGGIPHDPDDLAVWYLGVSRSRRTEVFLRTFGALVIRLIEVLIA